MDKLKVLGISGSLRKDSYNRKALQIAKVMAQELGADVTEIDLKSLALPIYDGDIETAGMPTSVTTLKRAVSAADVLLIASPEYNHSISGALKNAIDWLSRGNNSLDGKIATVFGASTGPYGTVRGLIHLRYILFDLNMTVIPQPQVHIGNAAAAFNADGSLIDKKTLEQIKLLLQRTLRVAGQLKA